MTVVTVVNVVFCTALVTGIMGPAAVGDGGNQGRWRLPRVSALRPRPFAIVPVVVGQGMRLISRAFVKNQASGAREAIHSSRG
jgi:hypothetical protein